MHVHDYCPMVGWQSGWIWPYSVMDSWLFEQHLEPNWIADSLALTYVQGLWVPDSCLLTQTELIYVWINQKQRVAAKFLLVILIIYIYIYKSWSCPHKVWMVWLIPIDVMVLSQYQFWPKIKYRSLSHWFSIGSIYSFWGREGTPY